MDDPVVAPSGLVRSAAIGGLYALAFVQLRLGVDGAWPGTSAAWRVAALGVALAVVLGLGILADGRFGPLAGVGLLAAPALLAVGVVGHLALLRRPAWVLCQTAPGVARELGLAVTRRAWVLLGLGTLVAVLTAFVQPASSGATAALVAFAAALAFRGAPAVAASAAASAGDAAAGLALPIAPDGYLAALIVLALALTVPSGRGAA